MEAERNPSSSPPHRSSKRTKIGASTDDGTFNLPEEIMFCILTHLPVKSLLKFRCVSKSWRSFISSPSFIKSHVEAAEKDPSFTNRRLILTLTEPRFDLKRSSLPSVTEIGGDQPSIDAVSVVYPERHPDSSVWVVGSCDGLLCVAINERDLFIWNPTTGVHVNLPTDDVRMMNGFYNMFGFGYSKATEEYKVVGIFCVFGMGPQYQSILKIYGQKSNSWRTIEDYSFKNVVPLHDSGKLVNGKLHFATTPGFGAFRWEIVWIDLDSEAHGIIEQPDYGNGLSPSVLGVLDGCLCVLCNGYDQQSISSLDVWVMKEYGDKDSWTNLVRIRNMVEVGRYVYLNPLTMLPNGGILLVLGKRLAIYNPRDLTWSYPEIRDVQSFLDAEIYVESLVSPILSAN